MLRPLYVDVVAAAVEIVAGGELHRLREAGDVHHFAYQPDFDENGI